MNTVIAKFFVGQMVHHKLFDYRGVILDRSEIRRTAAAKPGTRKSPSAVRQRTSLGITCFRTEAAGAHTSPSATWSPTPRANPSTILIWTIISSG